MPLQFALFELARNPAVQESVRRQVTESVGGADGDPHKALVGAPLLKGAVKEILRYANNVALFIHYSFVFK